MISPEKLEEKVILEHNRAVGKIILVRTVSCFVENDSTELHFDPPKMFRVLQTPEHDVCHWTERDWLDPYWDVEPLNSIENARTFWVFGTSYSTYGNVEKSTEWEFLEKESIWGKLWQFVKELVCF